MNIEQTLSPTILTLITTYKCSAACNNCCFECNPRRKEKLPLSTAISHIDYAVSKYKSLMIVVLTGGECFLDTDYLLTLISYIHTRNLLCRVVTNCFWAKSLDIALNILSLCKNAGLNEINISTGDDHLEYISITNIKNAIYAAVKLDFTVVVNIESGPDRIFKVDELLKDPEIAKFVSIKASNSNKLTIINGVWMPFTKESLRRLPLIRRHTYHPCMDRCSNLFCSLTISPDNRLLACCGLPVLYIKHLDLGNLCKFSMQKLYNNQFNDFLKIWLFVDGPYKILLYVENKHGYELPECNVLSHTCFYCAVLFTNKLYLSTAQKYYKEIFSSTMLRYSFLIKQSYNT